jgi:hypothetical protein
MNHKKITGLQKAYGFTAMQNLINSGTAWKLEGSVGREAMSLLESGACMLPKVAHSDYYGNRVPSRDDLKKGTKGTYQNSVDFWTAVLDGKIEIDEFAENENDDVCEVSQND